MRLNLARALMTPSDLLLLDEPTNHLDLDAVLWLEQWLLKYPGTLLLISHDREFLDNVTTHTLHLHGGKAKLYTGDYTAFERQRSEQLRLQQITHEKAQAERAHLQSFIDRFKRQRRARPSRRSRGSSAWRRWPAPKRVRAEREVRIDFAEPAKLPHSLMRLNHVDAGYASSRGSPSGLRPAARGRQPRVILHNVDFGLEAGDRIGLLGPNGAGKSTLVKTLVGELPLLSGERSCASGPAHRLLRPAHGRIADRRHIADRPPARPVAGRRRSQDFRDFLGKWNFPGDRAFESVDGFSGGERARLALALIAWRQPNVLLLDEPTNHLDLDMREALAEALSDFAGAIVLVSHDRHLIGLVCETFWRVADGVVEAVRRRPRRIRGVAAQSRHRAGNRRRRPAAAAPVVPTPAAKAAKPAKKVNPHKLAQAEARVAELEAELAAWKPSWPIRGSMPMAASASPSSAAQQAAAARRSWTRPRPSGWRFTRRLSPRASDSRLDAAPAIPRASSDVTTAADLSARPRIHLLSRFSEPASPCLSTLSSAPTCGHSFDRLQKLSDPDPDTCPHCGAHTVKRQLTAPSFRLSGSGWYETDFKKDGDKKRNLVEGSEGAGKAAATPAADAPKPAEKPSTPAAKTEAKPAAPSLPPATPDIPDRVSNAVSASRTARGSRSSPRSHCRRYHQVSFSRHAEAADLPSHVGAASSGCSRRRIAHACWCSSR